ncbi:aminopeptidase N [Drosophila willistoni]|uniref:aminopeptidase N n=1 Tax=Drosophila willistoni TaxID=7260 RepID=UPI001F076E6E|nr:aminopeptidase N [Drosophila willistoni]
MKRFRFHFWFNASFILLCVSVSSSLDYRLERDVVPLFYNLTIRLLADEAKPNTFNGDVSITLQAVKTDKEIKEITLHSDGLEIEECLFYNESGVLISTIDTNQLTLDRTTQKLSVLLEEALALNENYTIRFKYSGEIGSGVEGLFATTYIEEGSGITKSVYLTHMQAINARLVFPCFDEPAFKAKFQLHIERPSGYNAISNTKQISSSPESNNRYLDHFEVTPVMSTYLLTFIVSEYTARGNESDYAVVSRPEFYDNTEFSYNVGERVLPVYEGLFQQTYKELGNELLQHATTPSFRHNTMENWGLIIYKDAVLVQKPGYTDGWSDKEFTIRNIVHETSHMWFGDSVTLSWWSHVWLNEGFARYYEFFVAHELYPEYQLDQQFVVRKLQHIFPSDAVNSTQPLTSPEESIQTSSDIYFKFANIPFAKGGSIVRMWRNAMGHDNFDAAIRDYLKQHHLGNTEPQDLFYHLKQYWPVKSELVNLDQFLYDFTEQVGFPMIVVNASFENKQIRVEQNRFLLSPGDGSDPNIRYTIPITYTTNLAPDFQNLTPIGYFSKVVDVYDIWFDEAIDWIVFNLKQSNYYRVFYDAPLLNSLQLALHKSDHSGIAVENRAQIVDDLFSFARVGYVDYEEVFQFIEYLSQEVEFIPWYSTYQSLQLVANRLTPDQLPNFAKYLSDITSAVFTKLGASGKNSDSVLDVYNRNQQVAWLCKYQIKSCQEQVQVLYDVQKPIPDYRETFYCAAARTEGYIKILELYREETYPTEQDLLWRAASCTRNYTGHYQNEILSYSRTLAEKKTAISQMYQQNPDLVTPIFIMLSENITQLSEALGSWAETAQVISDLADYFTTREQHQLLSDFYDENHLLFGTSAETLITALNSVESNLQWAQQRLGRLVNFLSLRNIGGATQTKALPMVALLLGLILICIWS